MNRDGFFIKVVDPFRRNPDNSVITIPLLTPTQNIYRNLNPYQRKRRRGEYELMIRSEMNRVQARDTEVLELWTIEIRSFRNRLIQDDANLRGGAKGLVDALVNKHFIFDDADKYCKIYYNQVQCPVRNQHTEVRRSLGMIGYKAMMERWIL